MTISAHSSARTVLLTWPLAIYLAVALPGHLLWEAAQLPLYTIWSTGTPREIFGAVIHCTGGDVLITVSTLAIAAALTRLCRGALLGRGMVLAAIALGVAYAILSEWLNVKVWRSWAYAPAMPVLPGIGTGLTPLLQWMIVPALAFAIAFTLEGRRQCDSRPDRTESKP